MGISSLIGRLGKIFEANSNDALDHMEDPTKMTKQAVIDLKAKLQTALDAEVKLKALVIDKRTNAQKKKAEAESWGHKAEQILDRVDAKAISQEDGDRLAKEALAQQTEAQQAYEKYDKESQDQQKVLDAMDKKVKEMHDLIDKAENQAQELEMRQQSADAERDISRELTGIGVNNTKELLERMQRKTVESENMAQAYIELDQSNKSTKDEIDEVLGKTNIGADDALAALKAKRGNKTDTNA